MGRLNGTHDEQDLQDLQDLQDEQDEQHKQQPLNTRETRAAFHGVSANKRKKGKNTGKVRMQYISNETHYV